MNKTSTRNKAVLLFSLIAACICAYFWLSSRYPALNLKALMGDQTSLSGIGFDVLFVISDTHSPLEKVWYTTINWLYSNKNGMTFGLLLAPVVLCLFSLFQFRESHNRVHASLLGMVIGSPLGVCANCVAPIAISAQQAKAHLETSLAMMVSSPTLNVVAVTMMFAALPIQLVLVKLAFTLLMIVVGIPLIAKACQYEPLNSKLKPTPRWITLQLPHQNTWPAVMGWVAQQYCQKAWSILIRVVPLMVFAGFLGALFITFVPASAITAVHVTGYAAKAVVLLLVSLFSTLLPVPMTFDVIMAINLQALDTEIRYTAAVLLGLGSFSIYPYLLLVQNKMIKAANLMLFMVTAASFILGCLVHYISPVFETYERKRFEQQMTRATPALWRLAVDASNPSYQPQATPPKLSSLTQTDQWQLSAVPFTAKTGESDHPNLFTLIDNQALGLGKSYQLSINKILDEAHFHSTISEDINNDLLPDLLLSDEAGLRLFLNQGNNTFGEVALPLSLFSSKQINFAAIVDLNNDRQADIVFSAEDDGIWWLSQQQSQWQAPELLFNTQARFTTHISFADLNKDRQLDLILANWTVGSFSRDSHMQSSTNTVLLSENGRYQPHALTCKSGESLSTLVSQLDSKQAAKHLFVANDFQPQDCYYALDASHQKPLTQQALGLSHSPIHTMSYDSADFNNDGMLDVFATDIGDPVENDIVQLNQAPCTKVKGNTQTVYCDHQTQLRQAINSKPSMSNCVSVQSDKFRETCVQFTYLKNILEAGKDCHGVPAQWQRFKRTCLAAEPAFGLNSSLRYLESNQSARGNTLAIQNEQGQLINSETQWNAQHTGWTWNGQAADLNNDGWQDLYLATGYLLQAYDEPNRLLINQQGRGFDDQTATSGANSFTVTTSYTYIDYDFDGDLDIITNPVADELEVFRNNSNQHAIAIELRDHHAPVVGAKLWLFGEQTQLREVKLSGGFAALSNTTQYFGLAKNTAATQLKIEWPDGEITIINEPLAANHYYVLTRK